MRIPIITLTVLALGILTHRPLTAAESPAQLSDEETLEIAVEAYIYGYPLVLMDASRRVLTNVETPLPEGKAPINQFGHKRTFPDAAFTDVVRPNADTLYSTLWYDVTQEPLVITVPDSEGRFYLLPILDLWTDVFASPGKRTTGTAAQTFAIVAPDWQGQLPAGVSLIRSPTKVGWMIGRTQTNGKPDYAAVHRFQDGLKSVPLSSYGKPFKHPKGIIDKTVPKLPPVDIVARMDAAEFFRLLTVLTRDNPPHINDNSVLARMKRIGIEPGRPFEFATASAGVQRALTQAIPAAQAKIVGYLKTADKQVNGWSMVLNPVGTYGTDYLKRALIANMGLGANVVEDAIYPTAYVGPDGKPFQSASRYELHFTKDQIPPVRAFWSLTMYNEQQFFTANPIDRFAIGDRDKLKFGPDGSLTLYIQRESPGAELESNWLPAPKSGTFTMNLRLYWPKPAALDGTWNPPALKLK